MLATNIHLFTFLTSHRYIYIHIYIHNIYQNIYFFCQAQAMLNLNCVIISYHCMIKPSKKNIRIAPPGISSDGLLTPPYL
jgi:hypothetical protein